jgi:hypothetical protein
MPFTQMFTNFPLLIFYYSFKKKIKNNRYALHTKTLAFDRQLKKNI